MVLVPASPESEAGAMPGTEQLEAMTKYNEELVGGYWIWECASREEALEWLKRAPFDGGVEVELREVIEADASASS